MINNPYYQLLKELTFELNENEIAKSVENKTLFSDRNVAYGIMQDFLEMNDDEFDFFRKNPDTMEEWQEEWQAFCQAENAILAEF